MTKKILIVFILILLLINATKVEAAGETAEHMGVYDATIKYVPVGDFQEDSSYTDYYSQKYMIYIEKVEINNFNITILNALPEGTYVANTDGKKQNSFKSFDRQFKIMVPKDAVESDFMLDVRIILSFDTYTPEYNDKGDLTVVAVTSSNTQILTIDNRKSKLTVKCIDDLTGEEVKGVTLNVKDDTFKIQEKQTTNKNGEIKIEKIGAGSVTITIESVPNGYYPDNDEYEVEIQKSSINEYVLRIKPKVGGIRILNNVIGSNFELYNEEGNFIKSYENKDGTITIRNLKFGKYTLIQKNITDKFKEIEDITVLISRDTIEDLIIENEEKLIVTTPPEEGTGDNDEDDLGEGKEENSGNNEDNSDDGKKENHCCSGCCSLKENHNDEKENGNKEDNPGEEKEEHGDKDNSGEEKEEDPEDNEEDNSGEEKEEDPEDNEGEDSGEEKEEESEDNDEDDSGEEKEEEPEDNEEDDSGEGKEEDPEDNEEDDSGEGKEEDPEDNEEDDSGEGKEEDPEDNEEDDSGEGKEEDPEDNDEDDSGEEKEDPEDNDEDDSGEGKEEPGDNNEEDLGEGKEEDPKNNDDDEEEKDDNEERPGGNEDNIVVASEGKSDNNKEIEKIIINNCVCSETSTTKANNQKAKSNSQTSTVKVSKLDTNDDILVDENQENLDLLQMENDERIQFTLNKEEIRNANEEKSNYDENIENEKFRISPITIILIILLIIVLIILIKKKIQTDKQSAFKR